MEEDFGQETEVVEEEVAIEEVEEVAELEEVVEDVEAAEERPNIIQCPVYTGEFVPISERLYRCRHAWQAIDCNKYILSLIYNGIDLDFENIPPPNVPSSYKDMVSEAAQATKEQINRFLRLGAARRLRRDEKSLAVYGPMFAIPKRERGEWRGIFDLRYLNRFIRYKRFKMEGLHVVRELLRPNDLMTKLDIKDAYLHCAIKADHQKYLSFINDTGDSFCFKALPFGLSSAPRWFTKIMKEVITFIRRQGIRVVVYIDDIVIFTPVLEGNLEAARQKASDNHNFVRSTLSRLGFLIKEEKEVREPTQRMEILGLIVDSQKMSLLVPKKKIKRLKRESKQLIASPRTTPRALAKFLGFLNHLAQAILPERLRTRSLHVNKNRAIAQGVGWDDPISVSIEACIDLNFWIFQVENFNGRRIRPAPDQMSASDASKEGFGGINQDLSTFDQWKPEERGRHSTIQELDAAARTVKHFVLKRKASNMVWMHQTDNSVAVSYINKQGGAKEHLNAIAQDLWEFCLERSIHLIARHIPGEENSECDRLSRLAQMKTEWRLNPEVFHALDKHWGPFDLDIFASRENTQLTNYFSLLPDSHSIGTDAFNYRWSGFNAYAFPPFGQIGRVLAKLRIEMETIVLLAPYWEGAPWFVDLNEMIVDRPMRLLHDSLVIPPPGISQLEHKTTVHNLVAWRVSGNSCVCRDFQKQLQKESEVHGRICPGWIPLGELGFLGVNPTM